MDKKLIGILVCGLLICTVSPISAIALIDDSHIPAFFESTLHVGGSGPNNYTRIQEAIDDAVAGDTVFVHTDSSPYLENVVVNKSIRLVGENCETTRIIGMEISPTVELLADGITLQGFTLQHREELEEEFMYILAVYSSGNDISNNILIAKKSRRETQITLRNSSGNLISCNVLENVYDWGMEFRGCHNNEITGNVITGVIWTRGIGICLIDSSNNVIKRNEISTISCCVQLNELSQQVINNQITQNNFMKYYVRMSGVYFFYDYLSFEGARGNTFDENYWNRPRTAPKYVLGWVSIIRLPVGNYGYLFRVPLPKFDWNPAKEPYDI